jgi:hypothetical protein
LRKSAIDNLETQIACQCDFIGGAKGLNGCRAPTRAVAYEVGIAALKPNYRIVKMFLQSAG